MTGTSSPRSIRPSLETLEERSQPSFLLSGGANALVAPLNAISTDLMKQQQTLQTNVQFLMSHTFTNSFADINLAASKFAQASAAYQAVLNDQHAIQLVANADQAFIQNVALTEAFNGDTTDYVLLIYGPFFGFNFNAQFTNIVNQANTLVNSGNVTGPANAFISVDSGNVINATVAQQIQQPSF